MLADGKIDSLDTHLEQFKLNNQTNQNDLQIVLKEYSQLLDDYKTLKQAYIDKGTGVQRGPLIDVEDPQGARNPYVLVLIDGNSYIFNDELIKDKEEGGMKAARMLNSAVEKYLRDALPEARDCRLVVRIYADVTGLSKQLAKAKLVGLEKRSLAAFTAGFTRAIGLCDFVDALDGEGTKFKIRETFKLGAGDSSCSHILYAACHDASYLAPLVPYSGLRNKITLVQGAGFNSEFHQFGLPVTQFPTLFRWSELPPAAPTTKAISTDRTTNPLKALASRPATQSHSSHTRDNSWGNSAYGFDTTHSNNDSPTTYGQHANEGWGKATDSAKYQTVPCRYFQKGFCKNGNKCTFRHPAQNLSQNGLSHSSPLPPTHTSSSPLPPLTPLTHKTLSTLPTSTIPHFIPLNSTSHRLDTLLTPPPASAWTLYTSRFRTQKLCNSYHLEGICTSFACPFDHSALEPETRQVLEYVVRQRACPRGGGCRNTGCVYGHVCQKVGCAGGGAGAGVGDGGKCRMGRSMHGLDLRVASMVPGEEDGESFDGRGGDGRVDAEMEEGEEEGNGSWY
ncbi:hypothetical protein K491DRAFT_695392 [Lophiostoma macrostomum CBS 122681]|uniref:C3H1-type domain-containing protein n=1 Tax=Lophiostoma macrostomum CBS 122681 TaxID=1314788 RepID=A0A6A6T042_9PLEO|nr:hypothetical protein K491DRAFT_695392 [Lophiostoma macrostomum CBS 122681]